MGRADQVVQVWKEWGLQALVLLSFTLQVVLLILAEFRRRMNPGVLWAFLWSAYLLADSTAIYVLGHLSATSRSPEHELMAFWAPFLLLHLGGQDNITAYSMDDCRLWLRHLQTLSVQVAAAAYVLYQSSIFTGSNSFLLPATILVSVVGIVKYGERVWALRCAGIGALAMNEPGIARTSVGVSATNDPGADALAMKDLRPKRVKPSAYGLSTSHQDTEGLLLIAHLLLDIPKNFFQMPVHDEDVRLDASHFSMEEMYRVAEMQLSLMHDVFYTKAEVMRSRYGLCIRIFSTLATTVALLLFHLLLLDVHHHNLKGYRRENVSVTYVLLVGAVILETMSLWRAIFSSWTCALLASQSLGARNIWNLLGRGIMSFRRLVNAAHSRRRYWSGSMGQHNLFDLGVRSRDSRISRIARWIGIENPWNTLVYSRSIRTSPEIKKLVANQVLKSDSAPETSLDHIFNSRGRTVLKRWGYYEDLSWSVIGMELEESILVWHIATNVCLRWFYNINIWSKEDYALAEAVKALSDYMLFLLGLRPYMLPPPASRSAYVKLCSDIPVLHYNTTQHLRLILWNYGNALNTESDFNFYYATMSEDRRQSLLGNKALQGGSKLGARLVSMSLQTLMEKIDHVLLLIAQVWVEILCYAGYRCTTNSHTKQLSNGGELITVTAFLLEHRRRLDMLRASASGAPSASEEANGG
ncbi:hypothetical protein ACP70R_009333 [Stipagrostis hirtigluma subsp. patula]